MATTTTPPNILFSGAAPGADTQWSHHATLLAHQIIHYTFPTHNARSRSIPASQLTLLSDTDLQLGAAAVAQAAQVLGKHVPTRKPVWRLIMRNYYQIRNAERLYAVTEVREGGWKAEGVGGTAWACVMWWQKNPRSREMWVFCQRRGVWLQWRPPGGVKGEGEAEGEVGEDGEWEVVDRSPRPHGKWAGIGTRGLKECGRRAIRELMEGETRDDKGINEDVVSGKGLEKGEGSAERVEASVIDGPSGA